MGVGEQRRPSGPLVKGEPLLIGRWVCRSVGGKCETAAREHFPSETGNTEIEKELLTVREPVTVV